MMPPSLLSPLFRQLLPLACAVASLAAQAQEAPRFDTIALNAGMHRIEAEVARTPQEREYGLMFREKMAPNHGMVFVFDGPARTVCMWMKDTLIPLSVAFLDDKGKIINIEEMKEQTLDSHCNLANRPASYALEMNTGWFARNGIKPGNRISGLDGAKQKN